MTYFRFVVLALSLAAPGCEAAVTAAETQQVHPVLIRNEFNELLRIAVKVEPYTAVTLQEVTCSLKGTDQLGDLDAVALFSTAKGALTPGVRFGLEATPAAEISFRGTLELHGGENVLLLSGTLKSNASLSRRVAATCRELKTTAGALLIQHGAEPLPHRIGVALRKHNDDGVHTYRIPALTTSAKGSLLAVYDMRRRLARDLQEDIDIGLSRSTDGGRSWEPTRVIMDMGEYGGLPQELNGCSDPGIIVDHKTGEIFVFAVWMNGKAGKHQWREDGSEPGFEIGKSAQFLMVRSRDDGRTWSKPENLTRKLKKPEWWLIAPSPQQGIQLRNGELVMPVQGRDDKGVAFATIMVSGDHGKSWKVGAPAVSGGNECEAVVLGDGSIMLNVRYGKRGFRAVYITRDLGKTWSAHETNGNTLIEPSCNGSLFRLEYTAGGVTTPILLFANPHSQKGRTHHTLQVSLDEGRSWPARLHMLLDEGPGRGYPSITSVDAEHIGIVYEGSRADMTFEQIAIRDLLKK